MLQSGGYICYKRKFRKQLLAELSWLQRLLGNVTSLLHASDGETIFAPLFHLDALERVDELALLGDALYADGIDGVVVVVGPEREGGLTCAIDLEGGIPIKRRTHIRAWRICQTGPRRRVIGLSELTG